MPEKLNAITGATGFLGSYIAEYLVAQGEQVRALVRPTSDTALLQKLGAELIVGDLADRESIDELVRGTEIVYHCAAKTGNWGPWTDHVRETVETTRHVVASCLNSVTLRRLLHVSSIAVYGHPRPRGRKLDEDEPLGQRLWLWDYYIRAKLEAERAVRQLGERATIVRPTWIYGPRDPANLPAMFRAVKQQNAWVIGSGRNKLNMVYVGDVADAAVRCANASEARGQAYNICTDGELTQQELLDIVCKALGRPRLKRKVPYRLVHALGFSLELVGRMLGNQREPFITRHGMAVYARPTYFSSQKAIADFGWRPRASARERVDRTLEWLLSDALGDLHTEGSEA